MFSPDILNRFAQYNFSNNQKLFETLNQAISDRIALEGFHITGLEAVTKTLDLKNYNQSDNEAYKLLRSFKNILLTEIDQCKYLRESLQTDVLILVKQTYSQCQEEYKKIDKYCQGSYAELKKHLHDLKANENRYQQSLIDQKFADNRTKDKIDNELQLNKKILIEGLNKYNSYLDKYFMDCANLTTKISHLDERFRISYKDILKKVIIFFISMIKNMEYDLTRFNEYQKVQAFNENEEIQFEDKGKIKLNKFNPENYLMELEADNRKKEPSLNLYKIQAGQELSNLWNQVFSNKKEKKNEESYEQFVQNLILMPNPNLDKQQVASAILSNPQSINEFVSSLDEAQISQQLQNSVVEFTQFMQTLHKIIQSLIQQLTRFAQGYQKKMYTETFKIYKHYLVKLNGLKVQSELQNSVLIFKQTHLNENFLKDSAFCTEYIKIKLDHYLKKNENFQEAEVDILTFQIAELKFICLDLLRIYVRLDTIKQCLINISKDLNVGEDDTQLLMQYLETKQKADKLQ